MRILFNIPSKIEDEEFKRSIVEKGFYVEDIHFETRSIPGNIPYTITGIFRGEIENLFIALKQTSSKAVVQEVNLLRVEE